MSKNCKQKELGRDEDVIIDLFTSSDGTNDLQSKQNDNNFKMFEENEDFYLEKQKCIDDIYSYNNDDNDQSNTNTFSELTPSAEIFKEKFTRTLIKNQKNTPLCHKILKNYHSQFRFRNNLIRPLNQFSRKSINNYFKYFADQQEMIIQCLNDLIAEGLDYEHDYRALASVK